jgi:hypothetical protein
MELTRWLNSISDPGQTSYLSHFDLDWSDKMSSHFLCSNHYDIEELAVMSLLLFKAHTLTMYTRPNFMYELLCTAELTM